MSQRHAIVVIDLAFGDCGKGTIVDFLARRHEAHTVVRFNGGPQAGHNVVTPDGRHHTFSQFGSATFLPSVKTVLSRFMFIEPYALLNEAAHLREIGVTDALDRLKIDARCPVITPAHQAANRLRERARGDSAHGTCGVGFGEAVQDWLLHPEMMIRAGDLHDATLVADKLRALSRIKFEEFGPTDATQASPLRDTSWIDAAVENYSAVAQCAHICDPSSIANSLNRDGTTLYEGAQGVLLDQDFGFHPHTTWSRTTPANAMTILDEIGFAGTVTRIGTLRTYFTRHGAGPMVTEDDELRRALPEPHNGNDGWQGQFRIGAFDLVATRYALQAVGRIDGLAITHLDTLGRLPQRICSAYRLAGREFTIPFTPNQSFTQESTQMLQRCSPVYEQAPTNDVDAWIDMIQNELNVPVCIASSGPTTDDKRLLGNYDKTG